MGRIETIDDLLNDDEVEITGTLEAGETVRIDYELWAAASRGSIVGQ